MEEIQWHTRPRNYADEKHSGTTWKAVGEQHPLNIGSLSPSKKHVETQKVQEVTKQEASADDPLSRMAFENLQLGALVDSDPLSVMARNADPLSTIISETKPRSGSGVSKQQQQVTAAVKKVPVLTVADDLWASKRAQVLNTYTTREKISIRTAVLSAKDNIQEVVIQAEKMKPTDRVEQRLAELNEFDETSKTETVTVTVEEYLAKIADVNSMLTAAWRDEQRVKAVRLAIQCAKMLNDTSVIEFYPSKYVLITDILDNFGTLVFDRLRSKAESNGCQLPENFTQANVPNSAKETALNWFYKLASIRELLPRIYMQTTILQSLRFVSDKSLEEWLGELMMMTRGIANPLVQVYTSAYLCRAGLRVYFNQRASSKDRSGSQSQHYQNGSNDTQGTFSSMGNCLPPYLRKCIDDFILITRQATRLHFDRLPKTENIALTNYVRLFIPAVEWIFQCVSSFAANSNASSLLASEILKAADGHPNNDLFIHCLLSTFPSSFVVEQALNIAMALGEMKRPDIPKSQLFRTLGTALLNADPLFADRKRIFDLAWAGSVSNVTPGESLQTKEVLQTAEVWLEYAGKYLDMLDVEKVLTAVVEACAKTKQNFDSFSAVLTSTLSKFIVHVKDYEKLLASPIFQKFLDCFGNKGSAKADACRLIIEAYRKTPQTVISDQVFIDSLIFLCKTWHDAAMSYHASPDIARQMSKSIKVFVNRVDFGRDFEKLLQFYVDCRSTFVYLEDVIAHLILMANRVVMNVSTIVRGQHSKRTLNFAKASIAFCYITIPSIDDPLKQLRLSILTAQTALVNGCIGQAEALFKLAVTTLAEVPVSTLGTDGRQHSTDRQFAEIVSQLCSALLPLPDSPEQAALYIWQGLLNATLRYDWIAAANVPTTAPPNSPISSGSPKMDALLAIIHALAALSQAKYLYTVQNIDANDVLYGGDARFIARLNELAAETLAVIIADIEDRASLVLPPKKSTGSAIAQHQNYVGFIASSLLPILDVQNNSKTLKLANRFWELGGSNNQKLIKLKSILFSNKAHFTEQLFSSAAS